jgi:hypothetical protein
MRITASWTARQSFLPPETTLVGCTSWFECGATNVARLRSFPIGFHGRSTAWRRAMATGFLFYLMVIPVVSSGRQPVAVKVPQNDFNCDADYAFACTMISL